MYGGTITRMQFALVKHVLAIMIGTREKTYSFFSEQSYSGCLVICSVEMSVRCFSNPYSDVMDPNQPLVVGPTLAVHRAVELLQNCVAVSFTLLFILKMICFVGSRVVLIRFFADPLPFLQYPFLRCIGIFGLIN